MHFSRRVSRLPMISARPQRTQRSALSYRLARSCAYARTRFASDFCKLRLTQKFPVEKSPISLPC